MLKEIKLYKPYKLADRQRERIRNDKEGFIRSMLFELRHEENIQDILFNFTNTFCHTEEVFSFCKDHIAIAPYFEYKLVNHGFLFYPVFIELTNIDALDRSKKNGKQLDLSAVNKCFCAHEDNAFSSYRGKNIFIPYYGSNEIVTVEDKLPRTFEEIKRDVNIGFGLPPWMRDPNNKPDYIIVDDIDEIKPLTNKDFDNFKKWNEEIIMRSFGLPGTFQGLYQKISLEATVTYQWQLDNEMLLII